MIVHSFSVLQLFLGFCLSFSYACYTYQTIELISMLEPYCSEFVIPAADIEGLQQGVDEELACIMVFNTGRLCGARNIGDLEKSKISSGGSIGHLWWFRYNFSL
jgi:hypothetical protein